jgi:hypothetical protein
MSMHARRTRRWTGLVLSMGLLAVAPLAWAVAPQPAQAQAQGVNGYELPSAALQAVVDAPRAPSLYLSPRRDVAALMQMPSLPSIQVVAQPELKLAGLRINPRTFSDSRFSFGEKLWLMNVADGKERQISGLPATLSIASLMWSPDQKWLAFNQVDAASGANELWLVDVAAGSARRLVAGLNTVIGSGYQWLPDSRGLVVFTRPANLGAAPAADGIRPGRAADQPGRRRGVDPYLPGPAEERGRRAPVRLLRHHPAGGSQPGWQHPRDRRGRHLHGLLGFAGWPLRAAPAGAAPVFLRGAGDSFPRRIEVIDRASGKLVHTVAVRPLVEGLPTGNDAEVTGVRDIAGAVMPTPPWSGPKRRTAATRTGRPRCAMRC